MNYTENPKTNNTKCPVQLETCKNSPLKSNLGGEADLPCLNSNISTENTFGSPRLSTQQRKTAFILKTSVESLSNTFKLPYIGFLTLTFAEPILCPKVAQKRLNSLLSHVVKTRYQEYLGVFERQKSGRIHYHFLVVLPHDIRSGINFAEFEDRNYKSANKYLRSEWSFWRKTAKAYKFGRTELMPVKSNADAMARYVGKYISKHTEARQQNDKNVRLVRYSRGSRSGTTRFSFLSNGSKEWRRKLKTFAVIVQTHYPDIPINDISDFSKVLGKNWAHKNREFILDLP
jgi:hypothetical protein